MAAQLHTKDTTNNEVIELITTGRSSAASGSNGTQGGTR
jgi:hypothetical protein